MKKFGLLILFCFGVFSMLAWATVSADIIVAIIENHRVSAIFGVDSDIHTLLLSGLIYVMSLTIAVVAYFAHIDARAAHREIKQRYIQSLN